MDHSCPLEWSAAALFVVSVTRSSTKPKARPLRGLSEVLALLFDTCWPIWVGQALTRWNPLPVGHCDHFHPQARSDRSGPTLSLAREISAVLPYFGVE